MLILAGITAGVISTLSFIRSAASAYLILAILPFIIHVLLLQQKIYNLLALSMILYLLYLILLSILTHYSTRKIISLRFENIKLLDDLERLAT
ncbi:MAG: hypothetical protein ACK4PR_00410, partial [Gammaproteobacteria bacterium]